MSPLRHRIAVFVLFSLILAAFPARGQEPAPPAQSPVAEPVVGDVLTLKNGTRIVGQIVRSGPRSFAVRILEGIAPLLVDRSFVVSIEYDNFDPLRSRHANTTGAQDGNGGNTVESDELSQRLARRLYARFLEKELRYTGQDLIEILEDVSQRSGVQIRIHPTVRDMDIKSRRWTFVADRSTTVLDLFQDRLLTRFESLEVEFEFGQVVVSVKEATSAEAGKGTGS